MRGISVGTQLDENVVKEAKRDHQAAVTVPVAKTKVAEAPAKPKADGLRLVDYSERALVVVGDTTDIREELKSMGGKWMKMKTGGFGWMFAKRHLEEVAKAVGVRPQLVSE